MKHSQTTDRSISGLVRPVHTNVPGRTRLDFSGLYRSPHIRQQLEKHLQHASGIRSVAANIRTGRILVIHAPSILLEDIIGLIEELLGSNGKHRPVPLPVIDSRVFANLLPSRRAADEPYRFGFPEGFHQSLQKAD